MPNACRVRWKEGLPSEDGGTKGTEADATGPGAAWLPRRARGAGRDGFSQPGHLPGQGDFLTKHGNGQLEGFGETGGRAVSEKGLAIGEKAIRYERRPVQYEGRFAPQPVGESAQSGVFPFG